MFRYLSSMFFKEFGKTHVGVLDISTFAVSGALAVRYSQRRARGAKETYDIIKIFKQPVNLLGEYLENERRIPYALREGVLKILKDMQQISKHLDVIVVNFSDPFFLDFKLVKKIYRKNPGEKIEEEEVAALSRALEKEAKSHSAALAVVGSDILGSKINGYEAASPVGYKGRSLEVAAVFTLVNHSLHDDIKNAKDKFFPRAAMEHVSDSRLIWYLLRKIVNLGTPAVVLSVDGEATGVYLISGDDIQHLGLVQFGAGTLSRRVAAFLKIDLSDAKSLISRYCEDALEAELKQKVEKSVGAAIEDWWIKASAVLKNVGELNLPEKILLIGRDISSDLFLTFLKDNFKTRTGLVAAVEPLSPPAPEDTFHPPSVVKHSHILLDLLLYKPQYEGRR